MADHRAFWTEAAVLLKGTEDISGPTAKLISRIRRQLSFVANNLGVYFEDSGQPDEAFESYAMSREFDSGNVSALLNQSVMLDAGFATTSAGEIRAEMEGLVKDLEDRSVKHHIWALAKNYGYVRTPKAFEGLGWVWARSGQPALAVSGLKRALALTPKGDQSEVKTTLAGLYMLQQHDEESEALYYELSVESPHDPIPVLGLARTAARKGDFKKAKELLTRAESVGASRSMLAMEWATLHTMAGNLGEARIVLTKLVDMESESLRAWTMLADVLVSQGDAKALDDCLGHLDSLEGGDVPAAYTRARIAMRAKDLNEARKFFAKALNLSPGNVQVLEWLVRIDMLQGLSGSAGQRARSLLNLSPANGLGNYIMGQIHSGNGERDLAEESYRRSLAAGLTGGMLFAFSSALLQHPTGRHRGGRVSVLRL